MEFAGKRRRMRQDIRSRVAERRRRSLNPCGRGESTRPQITEMTCVLLSTCQAEIALGLQNLTSVFAKSILLRARTHCRAPQAHCGHHARGLWLAPVHKICGRRARITLRCTACRQTSPFVACAAACAGSRAMSPRPMASALCAIARIARRSRVFSSDRTCWTRPAERTSSRCRPGA
jgi:hypothetical protein